MVFPSRFAGSHSWASRNLFNGTGPTPGCDPHRFSRSDFDKALMFERWLRRNANRANKLYWVAHPKERFW